MSFLGLIDDLFVNIFHGNSILELHIQQVLRIPGPAAAAEPVFQTVSLTPCTIHLSFIPYTSLLYPLPKSVSAGLNSSPSK